MEDISHSMERQWHCDKRRGLSTKYAKMNIEIGGLAEDGMNLLLEKEWMEQPPLGTNHEELAKKS
ncbi:DUF3231 family protein [Robertmurraya korlensis]|uniref:DUF3231 family protein n=1 Tax=Robertmurraya korlensis TaxID=519977 RepID=UPI00082459BD|nr:DUF3231 family protein [Robertmurraya korlensis]